MIIEVADAVTAVGFTLLDDKKGNKIGLKLQPPKDFTIEIEKSILEIDDKGEIKQSALKIGNTEVKGVFKLELKGIYGFQPDPKAEQPQTAPQTTEDLPGWMTANGGVKIVNGILVVGGAIAVSLLMAPIKIYAAAVGIVINIVDPQPKDDPDNMA